jgi:prophage antirepressor-like protein
LSDLNLSLAIPAELNPGDVVLRMAGTQDEPLFCLADVCKVLELSDPSAVASRLEDDEKTVVNTPSQTRGNPNVWFVTEPGFYSVVLRSDKPNAKSFQRWVCHEVLPSIRKHGCYPPPVAVPGTTLGADHLAALFAQAIPALQELASFSRRMTQCRPIDDLLTVEDRCRQRGWSASAKQRRRVRDVAFGIHRERLGYLPLKLTGHRNGTFGFEREHLDILDRAIDVVLEDMDGEQTTLFRRPRN